MALIYIVDINHSTGVLRYSRKLKVTVGGNLYNSLLQQPSFLGQSLDFSSSFGGAVSSTVGEIIVGNADRSLDSLKSLNFYGYSLTLSTYDTVTTTVTPVLTRKIEQPVFEWDKISFRLIDESTKLEKQLQTKKYLGNNVLPDGLEGVVELKDKIKPLIFGRVSHFSPVLVNTSKLIYQLSSEPVQQVVSVFSNGSYVTLSGNTITTLADFTSYAIDKAPAAGNYTFYSGTEGSFIRLGMESGTVTCAAWEKISPIDCTVSAIAQRILTLAGYSSADWVASDFTYLDSIQGDSLGLFFDSETTVTDALNLLFSGTGCYWGFDSNNKFRVFQFGDFTQSSLGVIDNSTVSGLSGTALTDQISYGATSFEISRPSYMGKTAPVKEVKIRYDKNWTTIDPGSQAGVVVVTQTQRSEWLANEWRTAAQSTTSSYLTAQEINYDSYFISEFAAKAEAYRILLLTLGQRDQVSCTIRAPASFLQTLFPGKLVTVKLPRYSFDTGQPFIITSVECDYELLTANLTLWG